MDTEATTDVATAGLSDAGFAWAVVGLLLALFGIIIGSHIGDEWGQKAPDKRTYWKYNGIAYAVGIGASLLVWLTGWVTLAFPTVGMLGGAIAGLKMGYGASVGPWKAHDRFFNRSNKRAAAKRKVGADKSATGSWARRKPAGEPETDEPELMSVADPGDRKDRGR